MAPNPASPLLALAVMVAAVAAELVVSLVAAAGEAAVTDAEAPLSLQSTLDEALRLSPLILTISRRPVR
jgi:hypothetical protein